MADREKLDAASSEVKRSVELLSTDPTQYGQELARAAFNHYLETRVHNTKVGATDESTDS